MLTTPIVVGLNAWKKSGKDELCAIIMAEYPNSVCRGFADPVYEEVAKAHGLQVAELKALKVTGDLVPQARLALAHCADAKFQDVVYELEFEIWLAKRLSTPEDSTLDCADAYKSQMRKTFEDEPRSFRRTLQLWGTEYRRHLSSPTYWVGKMRTFLEAAGQSGVQLVLINDVRFNNEWDIVEAQVNGVIFRIIREKINLEMQEAIAKGDTAAVHHSEVEVANRPAVGIIVNEEGNPAGMLPQFELLIQARFGDALLRKAKPETV